MSIPSYFSINSGKVIVAISNSIQIVINLTVYLFQSFLQTL